MTLPLFKPAERVLRFSHPRRQEKPSNRLLLGESRSEFTVLAMSRDTHVIRPLGTWKRAPAGAETGQAARGRSGEARRPVAPDRRDLSPRGRAPGAPRPPPSELSTDPRPRSCRAPARGSTTRGAGARVGYLPGNPLAESPIRAGGARGPGESRDRTSQVTVCYLAFHTSVPASGTRAVSRVVVARRASPGAPVGGPPDFHGKESHGA